MLNNGMDYQFHYNRLIERSRNRKLDTYTEQHHIIPKCLGGANDPSNLVALTPEEHYVAHQLLVKLHPDHGGLVYAAYLMTVGRTGNKWYGWLRRRHHKVCKQRVGTKNGSYGRRWYYDPESKREGKFADGTVPLGWKKGRGRQRRNTMCVSCGTQTHSKHRKYCDACLLIQQRENCKKYHQKGINARRKKTKEEICESLIECSGDIRAAMKQCGYSTAGYGSTYMKFKEIQASLV